MAGGAVKSNPTKTRKRVEASQETTAPSLVRAKDGSAFAQAQVVEKPGETNKPTEKKKPSSTEPKLKKSKVEKKGKKGKDPNKPKRPPTAFFLFMDDFRKEFKKANPNSKDVKKVAKEGGEKWKAMADEEKKVYQGKSAELKAEYQKALEADSTEDAEEEAGSEKEAPEKEVQEVEELSDEQ